MLGVKITIVLIVVTLIYRIYVKGHILNMNREEVANMMFFKESPPCVIILGCMGIFSGIGIIYSVIYLLFFMNW